MGNEGRVYAFEPNTECYQSLTKHIKINTCKNIITEQLALSNKRGTSTLWLGDDMGASFVKENTQQLTKNIVRSSIKVKTLPLDTYIRQHNIRRLDVLKIDVEGAELQVLQGAQKSITRYLPVIIAETINDAFRRAGYSKKEFISFLSTLGYDSYIFTSEGYESVDDPMKHTVVNMLFIHKKKRSNFETEDLV